MRHDASGFAPDRGHLPHARPAGVNLTLADGRAAGQEIMHVHLHIRPRAPGDGVLTVRPCDPSNQAELAVLATHIRTGLAE